MCFLYYKLLRKVQMQINKEKNIKKNIGGTGSVDELSKTGCAAIDEYESHMNVV